jgi:hypothetical protein
VIAPAMNELRLRFWTVSGRLLLQIRQVPISGSFQKWACVYTMPSDRQPFIEVATPFLCPRLEREPDPAEQLKANVLLASTAEQVLLFHSAAPSSPLITLPMPPGLQRPRSLCCHLWSVCIDVQLPGTPCSGPSSSQLGDTASATQKLFQACHDHTRSMGGLAELMDKCLHSAAAPVCVGAVFVTCALNGHTAMHPVALVPAAVGLRVEEAAEEATPAGKQQDLPTAGDPNQELHTMPLKSCDEEVPTKGPHIQKFPTAAEVRASTSHPCEQPPPSVLYLEQHHRAAGMHKHWRAAAVPDEQLASAQAPHNRERHLSAAPAFYVQPGGLGGCEIHPPVWVLTGSISAARLGPAQVIGNSLATLLVSQAGALEAYAAGEQSSSLSAHGVLSTLQQCADNIGAGVVVLTAKNAQECQQGDLASSRNQAKDKGSTPQWSAEALDMLLEQWSCGDDGGCFQALWKQMTNIVIVRASFHGSPILQHFRWADGCPRWRAEQVGIHVAAPAQSQLREAENKGQEGPRWLPKCWESKAQVCTRQLQHFWRVWRPGHLSELPAYPADPHGSFRKRHKADATTEGACEHATIDLELFCVAVAWPFNHKHLPQSGGVAIPPLLESAIQAVLQDVHCCLSLADVWFEACAIYQAHALKEGTLGAETREVGGSNTHDCPDGLHVGDCQLCCHWVPTCDHMLAGKSESSERITKTFQDRPMGALASPATCEAIPGRVIGGAVNCVNAWGKAEVPKPECAHAALAVGPEITYAMPGSRGVIDGKEHAQDCARIACMVHILRRLGTNLHVQLHFIKSPAWVPSTGWEGSGVPQRSRSYGSSQLDRYRRPGTSMHDWIVVPVQKGGKHKLGRFEVVVGNHIGEEIGLVQEKMSELSKAWKTSKY